jgi:glycosyltransferase involved in cell wall biosynthesis
VYEQLVDCFISPSQFLRNKVNDWGEAVKRIEVLPNFIDLSQITPASIFVSAPGPAAAENYILYAGAMSEIKGVQLLLDNFKKNHYDCALLLAGDGPLYKQYQSTYQSNHIRFLGPLDKPTLFKKLAGARAVIVPSRNHENFPYSVVEALAHGIPVIGSSRGGIPELVEPGVTGYLFNPDASAEANDSLHTAITQLLSNLALAQQMGTAARQRVAQLCNPQHHYEQLMAIYQSLL